MPQRPVELILARQLAMSLSTAVFLVDPEGELLFSNEASERLLGLRFGEGDVADLSERTRGLMPRDEDGAPIAATDMPGMVAMREGVPVHRRLWLRGHNDQDRLVETSAFPIEGGEGRTLGSMVMFWEDRDRPMRAQRAGTAREGQA